MPSDLELHLALQHNDQFVGRMREMLPSPSRRVDPEVATETPWRIATVASGEWRENSGQWSVASECGRSGERRVASGDCEEGERERSEPTQEGCLAPAKAPKEAKLESTQSFLPLDAESSAPEHASRERSQSTQAEASGERRVVSRRRSGELRVASCE